MALPRHVEEGIDFRGEQKPLSGMLVQPIASVPQRVLQLLHPQRMGEIAGAEKVNAFYPCILLEIFQIELCGTGARMF